MQSHDSAIVFRKSDLVLGQSLPGECLLGHITRGSGKLRWDARLLIRA
jgi:hypothetical protein